MIFPRKALAFGALAAVSLVACQTRRPDRFLISEGFKGWAKIRFEVPNATPLPVEGRHWLLRLDSEGHLQTSTILEGGHAKDDFFYVSNGRRIPLKQTKSCQGGAIWGLATGSDPTSDHADTEWFFVGSEAEYRHAIDPDGRVYIPCLQ